MSTTEPSRSGKQATSASTSAVRDRVSPQPVQRDRGEQHGRDPASRHQPLEGVAKALVVVAQERRQGERRKRAGRVLRLMSR